MNRILAAVVVAMSMGIGVQASAQDEQPDTMFYDFNDMLIDGEFRRPEGMFATERGRANFDSLLDLRRSFVEEIEEAAHEPALQ